MTVSRTIPMPDGGHLAARTDGPERAPWIVLGNSVLTDLGIWDNQIDALTEDYRVLRFDQRGHGASSLPLGPMSFYDYGDDLLNLLDAFSVQRCVFVGLSMGVPTGLAAAARAPDRFAAFVAVDGVARSAPGREAFWSERRDTAREFGMSHIAEGTVERWLPGEPTDGAKAQGLRAMVQTIPIEGFAAATHALQNYDFSAALACLDCPFFGITGALDGAMPEAVRAQFGGLSKAQFADIPNAGHVPNFQNPTAFNTTLRGFLDAMPSKISKETT